MTGKLVALFLALAALLAGAGMYYLQVHAFYERLEPRISLLVELPEGGVTRLSITDFEGIDSDSSPLRLRACFAVLPPYMDLPPHPRPTPLNAPRWFSCFDAPAIAADLAAGRASAHLVEGNFSFGFDRVMALYPDGRAFLWQQMNACGEAHFDGQPLPPGCPPAP
ncbi:MAG: histidine kinase [Pararhodobacter sp.]|nr:histidine kinase [Pararhodobacter sp.]